MTWTTIVPMRGARRFAYERVTVSWEMSRHAWATARITLGAETTKALGWQAKQRVRVQLDLAGRRVRIERVLDGTDDALLWALHAASGGKTLTVGVPLRDLPDQPTASVPAQEAQWERDGEDAIVVVLPRWDIAPAKPTPPRAAVVPMPKPAPTPQRANKLPREAELSPREQDEREIEGLIRANRERWTGRVIAEEYGWPIQQAANFVTSMRAKIDAEMAEQAAE